MAEGDQAVAARADHRLRVVPLVGARGGVPHMADRHGAGQGAKRRLVKDVGHKTQVALDHHMSVVGDRDSRALLSAVLDRAQREERQACDVTVGRNGTEDTALLFWLVVAVHVHVAHRAIRISREPVRCCCCAVMGPRQSGVRRGFRCRRSLETRTISPLGCRPPESVPASGPSLTRVSRQGCQRARMNPVAARM